MKLTLDEVIARVMLWEHMQSWRDEEDRATKHKYGITVTTSEGYDPITLNGMLLLLQTFLPGVSVSHRSDHELHDEIQVFLHEVTSPIPTEIFMDMSDDFNYRRTLSLAIDGYVSGMVHEERYTLMDDTHPTLAVPRPTLLTPHEKQMLVEQVIRLFESAPLLVLNRISETYRNTWIERTTTVVNLALTDILHRYLHTADPVSRYDSIKVSELYVTDIVNDAVLLNEHARTVLRMLLGHLNAVPSVAQLYFNVVIPASKDDVPINEIPTATIVMYWSMGVDTRYPIQGIAIPIDCNHVWRKHAKA